MGPREHQARPEVPVTREAASLPEIIRETVETSFSERRDRVIDHDGTASMERKKQEGYF